MNPLEAIHGGYVHRRRLQVLTGHLLPLLPKGSTVLDVGCGDGLLARGLVEVRKDLKIEGIDTLVRPEAAIPVSAFDGCHIPAKDAQYDVVLFVDVLHHADNPEALLKEAGRVARHWVVIKDHTRNGWAAEKTLKFMDDLGNKRHGVALPYQYWSRDEWQHKLDQLAFSIETWTPRLGLYPPPASWLFDRSLHFIARLNPPTPGDSPRPGA